MLCTRPANWTPGVEISLGQVTRLDETLVELFVRKHLGAHVCRKNRRKQIPLNCALQGNGVPGWFHRLASVVDNAHEQLLDLQVFDVV
jgi:hypothetical protein